MSRRDPKTRILHMRDYALKAVAMVEGCSREEFDDDEKLQLALTRLVELIGEAANRVPAELKAQYPEIPWAKIISMRNRLIHGYDLVDYDILWETITGNLPGLIKDLNIIVEAKFSH